MRAPAVLSVILLGALAAGCFEAEGEVTLNPDGSGKVTGSMLFPLEAPWTGRARSSSKDDAPPLAPDPDAQMKEVVRTILTRSRGIDVWKDVSFEKTPEGWVRFKGTAYFSNLSDVQVYPDTAKSRVQFGAEGKDRLMLLLSRAGDEPEDPRSSRRMSAEALADRMKRERSEWNQMRGGVGKNLVTLKIAMGFVVPGLVEEVRGLDHQGRALRAEVDGPAITRALDAMMADNTWLRRMVLSGDLLSRGGRVLDETISDKVFGSKGDCWARLAGPFRDRFNYEAEVRAAIEAFPEMAKKLGLEDLRAPRLPRRSTREKKPEEEASPPAAPPPGADPDEPAPPGLGLPKRLPSIPAPVLPL